MPAADADAVDSAASRRVFAALAQGAPWISGEDALAHLGVVLCGSAYRLAEAALRPPEGHVANASEIEAKTEGGALLLSPVGFWKLAFMALATFNDMIAQTEAEQAALVERAAAMRDAMAQGLPPPPLH